MNLYPKHRLTGLYNSSYEEMDIFQRFLILPQTSRMKFFFLYLRNLIKGILFWLLVGCDNFVRYILGYSPLIRLKHISNEPASVDENITINLSEGSLSFNKQEMASEAVSHLSNNWLFVPFHDHYNLAICLRYLLAIRQSLVRLGLKPSDCHLLHKPIKDMPLAPPVLSLFNYFASHRSLADMDGDYKIDCLIRLGAASQRFWGLWNNKENIEACRKEFLDINGIEPSPPSDRVSKILFIQRADPLASEQQPQQKVILRKIANEAELIERLGNQFTEIELEAVRLERMTLVQQLNKINSADILIGMHGAGLIYSMFTKPNSGLIEIFPCHFAFPHTFYTFYVIAAARPLHYARFCQMFPWRDTASEAFNQLKKTSSPHYMRSPDPYYYTGMFGDYSYIDPQAIIKRTAKLIKRINASANS